MKLVSVLIFLCVFQLKATVHAQNISIDVKGASLKEVFSILSKQSSYEFMYDSEMLQSARPVTIKAVNASVKSVLDKCFSGQELNYTVKENTIIVSLKDPVSSAKLALFKGRVTDDKNLPLAGVSVKIKGAGGVVLTNSEGLFSINAVKGNILVFSYVGFDSKEIVLADQLILNVSLQTSMNDLSDVVITGYGTQKRADIISSIGEVNVSDMKKAPVASFEEALAGRVAGVQVTSAEGGPLSSNNIVIRGNNSVTQENSPLWVIDGFPMEDPNNKSINPNDIESITVLKDAASTAIYGSRGANGVILVTTKQGKAGQPVIAFDGSYGYQKTLKLMDLLDPYEYVKVQQELVGLTAMRLYTPGDPELARLGDPNYDANGRTLDYYKTAPSVNWQEQLYRSAPFQNYSLSLSGGTNKSSYMVSGSITDQDGTIKKTGFKRYQGRFVFKQEISSKATFNLNVNYANTFSEGNSPATFGNASASYSLLYGVWGYRPTPSASSSIEDQLNSEIDPDGQLAFTYNPLISTLNTTINSNVDNLAANSSIDYKISEHFTFKISGGMNSTKRLNNTYYSALTARGGKQSSLGPNGSIINTAATSLLNENTLTYRQVFNKYHSLNVLGGFSMQGTKVNNSGANASQVPNDELGVSGLDEGTPYAVLSGSSNNFLNSYFARANYNYKSKYYLSAVARADGSSKFAPGHQWGYFPSGAIAWNIANESFMKEIKYLRTLKLRASYGVSGNNRVNDFAYLSQINLSDINNNYAFGNAYTKGAVQPVLANRDLKWETTATTDIGIDMGFLNDKISIVADYYNKKTTDLLLQATVPGHLGYTSAIQNIGSIRNSGWELTLNTVNIDRKEFRWNSNFNISFNTNEVLALSSGQKGLVSQIYYDTNPQFPYIAVVGGPIAQFIGYKWLGNYQYDDFDLLPNGTYLLKSNIPTNGNTRGTIKPGDIRYEDINGDGTMNDSDKIIIGSPNPKFTGGFANDFRYKDFDLNVLFTFSYGNDLLNANRIIFEGSQNGYLNQFATFANRWTPENQTNLYPRAGGTTIPAISSRVIEDGSFLRLKTVSLGYNMPSSTLQKIKVKNARIFCSAQNLAVWSNYEGSDPEVSTRPGALTQGFDFASYPRAFTLTFGLNFSF